MSDTIYLVALTIFFGTSIAIFAMRYHALDEQARARLANDEAYRKLAEEAAAAQAASSAALSTVQTSLADLGERVNGVDKILKQVE